MLTQRNYKKHTITLLKIILSLSFMFCIIYYLFGKNPESLKRDLLLVDYKYVILSMVFGGLAYVSRGMRWIGLIDALGYETSKLNSISAVSVGYFTNLFIPRAGEISRCTTLNQVEKTPIDKLFGTILIERVIDFIFLLGLLFFTIVLKFNDIFNFYTTLQSHQTNNNSLVVLLGTIVVSVICIYFLKKWLKKSKFYEAIASFIKGLKEGFKSIKELKKKSVFWFHTFSIWIMYFLMTYICFHAIPETSHLTISDGLFLLVLGGIGMVIPTPGGFGSYHTIVMVGLCVLQIPESFLQFEGNYDTYNPALLFPTVVWFAQSSVAVILGSLSLLFLSKKKRNVTS